MNEKVCILLTFLSRHFSMRGAKIIIVLVLMAVGMKNAGIRKEIGTSWDSLAKYRQALEADDLDSLFHMPTDNRQKSEMELYNKQIDASFDANPPKTLREAESESRKLLVLTGALHEYESTW